MKKERLGKRIASWLLCMVMVLSIVNLPTFTNEVQAAGLPISSVDINVTEPFAGEIPQLTYPEAGTGYQFTDISWAEMDKPAIKHTGVFEEGKRYVVSICVKPTVGNKLASKELFSATINGKTARLSNDFDADNGGWISYIFPSTRSGIAHGEGWWIDSEGTLYLIGKITNNGVIPWAKYNSGIKRIITQEGSSINNCEYLFSWCTELIDVDLSNLDITGADSMEAMFDQCSKLESAKLSGLDTANVESMYQMFRGCESLTDIEMDGINTSRVVNMRDMFADCKSLVSLDLSDFRTDNLDSAYNMLHGCSSLAEVGEISEILLGKVAYNLFEVADYWAEKKTGRIYKDPFELVLVSEKVTLLKEKSENHDFTNQPYVVDADGIHHNQTCKVCGYVKQGNHDFSKQPYQVDEDGKHYQKCKDCGAESTREEHTGGTATCKEKAKCTVCGKEYGSLEVHTLKTTTTKATLTANGKKETRCTVCGKVTKTETIYAAKTIKLSATKYTYDGKVKKPSVTIKDSKGNVIASDGYTVTYPSGRKNVGKYTVKVTFKGNYSGSKNLTFTINPLKTSISKVTAGKKAFTVKWAKKQAQVTGYEIQYSTSSSFAKGNKTVKVTSAKTVSKTISKLTGGKKYYVRIRTYKTVGKTPYYSDWSAKKSVTTKK